MTNEERRQSPRWWNAKYKNKKVHERLRHATIYQGDVALIPYGDYTIVVDTDIGKRLDSMIVLVREANGYPQVSVRLKGSKKGSYDILARFVLDPVPAGMYVDHVNRNSLDNRRANLRLATPAQNAANIGTRKRADSSSRFKGVHRTENGSWSAVVSCRGVHCRLGTYRREEDAAMAYDMGAIEIFQDFAALNFPERLEIYRKRLREETSYEE